MLSVAADVVKRYRKSSFFFFSSWVFRFDFLLTSRQHYKKKILQSLDAFSICLSQLKAFSYP